jgi:hypothetical protein
MHHDRRAYECWPNAFGWSSRRLFWLYIKDVVPSLRVNPYPDPFTDSPAPLVWLELASRAIAIVVLLLIAQAVLERREIRA